VLIGSYDINHSRREHWIRLGVFSAVWIGMAVSWLILAWGTVGALAALSFAPVELTILYVYLFRVPWRVELTQAELRWHTLLLTRAAPLSQVRSIDEVQSTRREDWCSVWVRFDGRRPLQIQARLARLGTLVDDFKAVAPDVRFYS